MLILLSALSQKCKSKMDPDIAKVKPNMSIYCSGEAKCVSIAYSELNTSSCPTENPLCNALNLFIDEYTNELPEGTDRS